MASQFTVYSSLDAGAIAGSLQVNGNAGSLITVLDACLINGYTGKAAAGWTRGVATASNITAYKQGAGSLFAFVLNDNAPNATSLGKEAWAIGWESASGVGSPVGSGTGQFPTPAQLLTSGHVVIRKSSATGTGAVPWFVFADSRTCYLFISTGDAANTYYAFMFGDIYSIKSTADAYNCVIIGGNTENSTTNTNYGFDLLGAVNAANVGSYIARAFGGLGTSTTFGKHGDGVKGSTTGFAGTVQYPNGADTDLYLSPVWLSENGTITIRGRLRGIYQPLHAVSNFTDGQTFTGTGDYAGKTFQAVKNTPNSTGTIFIETSNTVETN